jgi:type II secretory pathway component GspD/PulD (secretin)
MKRFLSMLLFAFMTCTAMAAPQFKIITLQHRFAEELLPVLQPLAGRNGTVSAFSNQLIVNAEPDALASIEATARMLDIERRNWHITVSNNTSSNRDSSRMGASGEIGRDVRVGVPDSRGRIRRGVNIELEENQRQWSESGNMDLRTLDGEAAFIRVGQEIPYTTYWVELSRRYARVAQDTQWRDVSVGFAIRPCQIGEKIDLEITPRLAAPGKNGVIDFTEMATHIQARPGEWVDLGGMLSGRNEVNRAILSSDQANGSASTSLRIKVE